jgi:hypothetical protein
MKGNGRPIYSAAVVIFCDQDAPNEGGEDLWALDSPLSPRMT